ncbi:DUF305 domain-containing protein [Couchioplanes caeruleus]|uniref:DUF305 domain-containing protein n=2 Tax=Couchioplanes caeruleus TaxID=56438 RepID=A0A1K0GWL9_9ACTN|nr:DUF305 domain-containing protein [Couchioplanes caeruleus]OJF13803.1 hypothetical protein BG844_13240 [Couchioplanes caeruleus subsp. caeruleus]ROP34330.1 uncharacterized protein (DUF305 family) [Couchioplanes caeruleus]
MSWRRTVAAVLLAVVAGCGSEPAPAPAPAYGATDVMFLQMGLAYADQGDRVAGPTAQRAADPRLRSLAAEVRERCRAEARTMRDLLAGWRQPVSANPAADAHAGHGDLHSLRDSDIAELSLARGDDFDRTAVALLLGHLHRGVEVSRMESAGGRYPPARELAEEMTTTRRDWIRRLLALA